VTSDVVPVGLLTSYVREVLERDPLLSDLWVEGEIGDLFRAKSGHVYFTLRDDDGQIKCVLFRTTVTQIGLSPIAGDQIAAHGRVTLYPRDGAIQLYIDMIQPAGVGIATLELERLRQRLEAEGLFEESRKRALPPAPQCIGVVTSPDGAAWHDIQQVITRRYPFAHLILSPTVVQGNEAPESIVRALEVVQADGRPAVIILARGGGSSDDLAAFNDERVVRAVFASRVPVITGVGHETDHTLVDEVADLRAPTPSAAAELSVPSIALLPARINEARERLRTHLGGYLADRRDHTSSKSRDLQRRNPITMLETRRQTLDSATRQLSERMRDYVDLRRAPFATSRAILEALDPVAVLQRGYAVVQDEQSGKVIARVADALAGQTVRISFVDGAARSRIEESGQYVTPWREDNERERGVPA